MTTYYVATTGNDSTGDGSQEYPWLTIQHAHDEAAAGDTINVAVGTYAERPTLTKVASAVSPLKIQCDPANRALCQGFTFTGAQYVTVDGFEIERHNTNEQGGSGVFLGSSSTHCTVKNCYIHNCAWYGFNVGGSCTYLTIQTNVVRYCYMAGMIVFGTDHLIVGNEISHTLNESPDVGQTTGYDADGVRFFGTRLTFRGNYVHDILYSEQAGANMPHIDAFQTWNNPASVDCVIEDNVVDLPQHYDANAYAKLANLEYCTGTIVRNNVARACALIYSNGMDTALILGNTFIQSPDASDWRPGIQISNGDNNVIYDNIFHGHLNGGAPAIQIDGDSTGNVKDYNCIYDDVGTPPGSASEHDVWDEDPLIGTFPDVTLGTGSPCIAAGVADSDLPDDIAGTTRPDPPDIGAYQYDAQELLKSVAGAWAGAGGAARFVARSFAGAWAGAGSLARKIGRALAGVWTGLGTPGAEQTGLPLFSSGFETGDFTEWARTEESGTGAATVQGTVVKNGSYAGEFATTTGVNGDMAGAEWDVTWPAEGVLYYAAWVRLAPGSWGWHDWSLGTFPMMVTDGGYGQLVGPCILSGGATPMMRLAFRRRVDPNEWWGSAPFYLTPGTWYRFKFKVDLSGANPVYTWWVDGSLISAETDDSEGTVYDPIAASFGLEIHGWWAETYATWQIDDAVVSETDPDAGSGLYKAIAGVWAGAGAVARKLALLRTVTGSWVGAGAASGLRILLRAVSGTWAGTGALAKRGYAAFAGAWAGAGSLARKIGRALAGVWTGLGDAGKGKFKELFGAWSGETGPGASRQVRVSAAGVLVSVGSLLSILGVAQFLGGFWSGVGNAARTTGRGVAGAWVGTGTLREDAQKWLTGVWVGAGNAAKALVQAIAGAWTGAGGVGALGLRARLITGIWQGTGNVARQLSLHRLVTGLWSGAGTPTFGTIFAYAIGGLWSGAGALVGRAEKLATGVWAGIGAVRGGARKWLTSTWSGAASLLIGASNFTYREVSGIWAGAGSLARQLSLHRLLAGVWASAGSVTKGLAESITGTWTGAGQAARATARALSGAWHGIGNVVRHLDVLGTLSGLWAGSGALVRHTRRIFPTAPWAGTGGVTRATTHGTLTGLWSGAGHAVRQAARLLAGVWASFGQAAMLLGHRYTFMAVGMWRGTGGVRRRVGKVLIGVLDSVGALLPPTLRKIVLKLRARITLFTLEDRD